MFRFLKNAGKSKSQEVNRVNETVFDSVMKEFRSREEQLFDQLRACPVVDITGLVHIRGVGVSRTGRENVWTMTFKLDVWRIDCEGMKKDLVVRCKVTEKEFKRFQRKIKPESIIRIEGRVLGENMYGNAQALMEKFVKAGIKDVEMEDYRTEIRKPVDYQDDLLGSLRYDRISKCYTNSISWMNGETKINLPAANPDEPDAVLAAAHILYKDQTLWDQRIVDYLVTKLLPLKNDSWIGQGEDEITEEQFKEKIELSSITVQEDGSYEFAYDDGDLFMGHALVVTGNLADGPDRADLEG